MPGVVSGGPGKKVLGYRDLVGFGADAVLVIEGPDRVGSRFGEQRQHAARDGQA
jgi:hypothetical protein